MIRAVTTGMCAGWYNPWETRRGGTTLERMNMEEPPGGKTRGGWNNPARMDRSGITSGRGPGWNNPGPGGFTL